jgi:ABC-type spermidine/putrescine transport system permease subunit I
MEGGSKTIRKSYFKTESVVEYALPTCFFLFLPLFLLYGIFFVYPLVRLFPISCLEPTFTLDHYSRFFKEPLYTTVLLGTFRVSLIATIVCLVVGYPVAYVLANTKGKRLAIYVACVILPFWTSILVRNYAWIVIFQRRGMLNTLLQWIGIVDNPLRLLYNEFAVVLGMIHFLLPLMILPIYSVLRGIDRNLVMAAYNLGARPWSAFLLVILPLSLPGIGAGVCIVFIMGLGFFITPALLGGPRNLMISTLIEKQLTVNDWPFAAAGAFILLFITMILIMIFNKIVNFERVSGR